MGFRVLSHALHLGVGETRRSRNGNMLGASRGLILGSDFENTVRINIKGNFDLRNAARRRRNSIKAEFAKRLIVGCHRAFTLKDVDLDLSLIIRCRGKGLTAARGNGGVAFDLRRGHRAQSLNGKRKRCHVEQ